MDRLTKWNERLGRWTLPQGRGTFRMIAERLAAYENTGLEPEEIAAAKECAQNNPSEPLQQVLKKKYPVLTFYSWDDGDPVVDLFDTKEAAREYLERIAEEEHNADMENGGGEIEWSNDRSRATLTVYWENGETDVTVFALGYEIRCHN